MTAPQKQHRRTVVRHIRTTVGLVLGIASLVLAAMTFSPAIAANGATRQSKSAALSPALSRGVPKGMALSSPNTNDSTLPVVLIDVTCISGSDCWAVGYNIITSRTLIKHWNGIMWSIVPSPNPEAGYDQLFGVACVTASDCWAVGGAATQAPERTLIEHWDGVSWTVVASPNVNPSNHSLASITCSSASQCWAVGYYDGGTLIERWDGVSWAVVASPNVTGTTNNLLVDITCASATSCWAIGRYNSSNAPTKAMIERWNGTVWSIVSSPNAAMTVYNVLNSVVCASLSDCYAVGSYLVASTEADQTLIEHWNGSAWSIVPSANTSPTRDNDLWGVSCASSADCWAVGPYGGTGGSGMLIEHWNGSAWTIAAAPIPNSLYDHLYDVSCVSTLDCWAVGTTEEVAKPSTVHWNGSVWSVFPSLHITGTTHASDVDSWTFSIDGQGPASSQIDIQATSDLKQPFVTIGSTTSDPTGSFHYQDSGGAGSQPRLYRAHFESL